jgi:hypothetical protein
MNPEIDYPVLVVAILVFIVIPFGFVMTFRRAMRASRPKGPVVFVDEAVTKLENKPWSPTRGFYYFNVADLPEAYRGLSGVAGNHVVNIIADDEADARRRLLQMFLDKTLAETGTLPKNSPAITQPVARFRVLNMRKGERRHVVTR